MTDMTTWLGPAAEHMTSEQIDRFTQIWDDIDTRYPGDDLADLRAEVLSAAVQYLLGETGLDSAADRLAGARAAERTAMAVAKQTALLAIEDGLDEVAAAKALGVNRRTLRRAAGK